MTGFRSVIVLLAGICLGVDAFAHDPGLSSAHIIRHHRELRVELAFAWSDLASLLPSTESSARPDVERLRSLEYSLATAAGALHKFSKSNGAEKSAARFDGGSSQCD